MALSSDPHDQVLANAQKAMKAGSFDEAADLLVGILETEPALQDAYYMAAVCDRYLGRHQAALSKIEKLKAIAPDFGRAFQEEGHLWRKIGNRDKALNAYQRACQYNPALTASWQAQADLCSETGRKDQAEEARAQTNRLNTMPHQLLAITNFIHEGKILKAEQHCRAFMQKHPRNIEGMRLLADIGSRLGANEDADFLLETAIELDPENIQLRLDHIQVLRKRQKFVAALEQARNLLEKDPTSPIFQSHFAIESMQAGEYDTAIAMFDKVLAKLPDDPATLTSRGHALKTYGKTEEAIASYRAAFTRQPDLGDAYYALANLKTHHFTDQELAAMQAQELGSDLSYMSRVHICFALGKAYEDRGDYQQSYHFYARGNELKRIQTRYTSEQMEEELLTQISVCTEELFKIKSHMGCSAPDPIFILGLPRAGSTLIEQILASHSQVDGTLELPNILSLVHRLRGRKQITDPTYYPRILHDIPAEKLSAFGNDYIKSTRIHRQDAPFFTDKMPNNFRHIGLIHMILPNAKIIDARREPMDCCWSGFKQLFAEGQEFTYSLEDMGRYYRAYVALMDHWDRVLPGRVLRVQHEDVLDDLETQVRRILNYCDLPFEQDCIDFHKTSRAVRTASSEQVRQPISKKGMDQWKPFESYLSELKEALGDCLTTYRN